MYRISELNQIDRKLLHANDLAVLWGISNRATLNMTLFRYMEKGVLFPVYKGLYATVPLSSINPLELGQAIIHRYAYLSTETILAQAGLISQWVYDYTFVAHRSKRVVVKDWSFRFRQLKPEFLYHPAGISRQNGVFTASPERAVADMLYFNSKFHFDVPERIDFDQVRAIQTQIGYPYVRP